MSRPAKPSGLVTRAETKAKKAQRVAKETALRPGRALPVQAPAQLAGHRLAEIAWRRLMRIYSELEAEIVTRLDLDLLLDYCLLAEQVAELDAMRKSATEIWKQLDAQRLELIKAQKLDEALTMASKVTDAFDSILRIDGRVDRKRDLMFKMRQSLYLTPRARAGAAPTKKEKEEPPDEMEQLLDDVSDFMNGDQGHAG
jgi:phage terminase small subunit